MEDYWREKNVFVTGAMGFLGSWLTESLVKQGANVVILIRDFVPNSYLNLSGTINKVIRINGKLEDYFLIERILNEHEIDTCFHLGAQAIVQTANRSPLSTFESNIKGTWNILEAARNSKLLERLVVSTSDKAYGESNRLPYREDDCLRGLHPYDVSKSCADLLCQAYHETYKIPIGIVRCGNLYGGGDFNFNRIIPGTIKSLLFNQRPIIRSDGTYMRDYFYIEDAVDAFLTLGKALDNDKIKGEAFNFGAETPITVLDLVNKIIKLTKKESLKPRILNQASNEIREQYLSCEKANKLLNWKHGHSLDEGLKKTVDWYKKYFKQ
jgi:CDP-glucose 4,6-dehydratase